MDAPDARTRKVSMMPSSHRVRSTSIPANVVPQVLLSNILFALAIHAGKECILKYDVGIFWVTLRVLAFGGLAVLIKEAFTGELTKKKSIEVCIIYTSLSSCTEAFGSGLFWECHHSCFWRSNAACSPFYIECLQRGE